MKQLAARTRRILLSLFYLLFFKTCNGSYYNLDSRQCSKAIEKIGVVLDSKVSDKIYGGKFVSSRCELRLIQDDKGGTKAAFLLRAIDIANKRRWIGNYFFYRDEDCVHAIYGLKMQGKLKMKNSYLTLSLHSLSIAVYNSGFNIEILKKYNRSCRGDLTKSGDSKHITYSVDPKYLTNQDSECLKALGIGIWEFSSGVSLVSHHPSKGSKLDELVQRNVNLERGKKNRVWYSNQLPLVRLNKRTCLTCTKVGVSRFKLPPKLLPKNSTSLDGTWATSRCDKINTNYWTTRVNTFKGNKFTWIFYHMDPIMMKNQSRCSKPLLEYRILGHLRKVGTSPEVPGGVIYELFITHAYLTPRDKIYESILNKIKHVCGKKEWHVGEAQDIMSTHGCRPLGYILPAKGESILALIRTVNNDGRKEMYMANGASSKTGPLKYEVLLESCETFPVQMPTPFKPSMTTTQQSNVDDDGQNDERTGTKILTQQVVHGKKPTSSGERHFSSALPSIWLHLLITFLKLILP